MIYRFYFILLYLLSEAAIVLMVIALGLWVASIPKESAFLRASGLALSVIGAVFLLKVIAELVAVFMYRRER